MGCDIHFQLEVKQDGPWKIKKKTENDQFTEYWWDWNDSSRWMNVNPGYGNSVASAGLSRNYGIFGVLFGVRNYWEFDAPFADRGLPKATSTKTKKALGPDDHSVTWFTITEVVLWWEQHKEDIVNFSDGTSKKLVEFLEGEMEEFLLYIIALFNIFDHPYSSYLFDAKARAQQVIDNIIAGDSGTLSYYGKENKRVIVSFDN